MHRGWVGITFTICRIILPSLNVYYFHMLYVYTHGWEGFDRDNVLCILQITQGTNSIGNTTFAYMAGLESLQLS